MSDKPMNMISFVFKKPHWVLLLLSVFCASCINELRLIKVNGRDPIPYEFTPISISTQSNEEPVPPLWSNEKSTTNAATSDGGEATSTENNIPLKKIVEQKSNQNTPHNQHNTEKQVKSSFIAKRIAKKAAAIPPPNQTNVIIGSILIVVGTVLIIGGIASLFSAASGVIFVVLGALLATFGTILVFIGVATRKPQK